MASGHVVKVKIDAYTVGVINDLRERIDQLTRRETELLTALNMERTRADELQRSIDGHA